MTEYQQNTTPEDEEAFIPRHVQEYMNDTLHIFAGIRMENGIGGLSMNSGLLNEDTMEMQYARLMLSQSLHDALGVLDNKIREWFENPDNAQPQE